MKQFKPNLIKAALISGGVAFVSTPTFAQESNSDSIDESNVEVIQVSGIRGSLQRAQAIKMDNTILVNCLIPVLPNLSHDYLALRVSVETGVRVVSRTWF